MSEELMITPPCSPILRRNSGLNMLNCQYQDDNSLHFTGELSSRMFCCMGEPDTKITLFHENSYLRKNDIDIINDKFTNLSVLPNNYGPVILFDNYFDKGAALIINISNLFKMAKFSYMQLNNATRMNINHLDILVPNKKTNNSLKYRENIVNFLLYVRNYIQRIGLRKKYVWLIEDLFNKLNDELRSFYTLLGPITNIPNYIINYASSSVGNKCIQPSYHLFHCQLDVKWLHITILYLIISYKQRFKDNDLLIQSIQNNLSYEILNADLTFTVSDLIVIALKRFHLITFTDLPNKTLFTCTCIKEFWKLLQLFTDQLAKKNKTLQFWDFVNETCSKFKMVSNKPKSTSASTLTTDQNYSCSNPTAFSLWLLKDLGYLYMSDNEIKSNYQLLENSLKQCLICDVPESELRIYLNLVESILNIGWEAKIEPLNILWEYFHKRFNQKFLIPGASINNLGIVSKNSSGWLTQLNDIVNAQKSEQNTNSFYLFLRLLNRCLHKYQDTPRFWNQFKGRILSKISTTKLLNLNETGMYNFISLFLVLTFLDLEMAIKLQSFFKALPLKELDIARLKLIWKANFVLILLFAERNENINVIKDVPLSQVEFAADKTEYLSLMRIFSEGFQDLIDSTNNFELGQYMLVGNWIPLYLSHCSVSDSIRLFETFISLIGKLNSILSVQLPISEDSQLILMFNALWEHLTPYLRKASCSSASPYQISDVAFLLTTTSIKSCFSHCLKKKATDFFRSFITSNTIDVKLLCRYLNQMCQNTYADSFLSCHNFVLIKNWVKCLILTSGDDNFSENITDFTRYITLLPEMKNLLGEMEVTHTSSHIFFEMFIVALQQRYSSISEDNPAVIKLFSQFESYFSKFEDWLSHIIKVPKSLDVIVNIYHNVGLLFLKIPKLLYMKFKPNCLLQRFINILLLPPQIRTQQYKLHAHVSEAIKNTLFMFLRGLFTVGYEKGDYIDRCIRDIVTIYVPLMIVSKGTNSVHNNRRFSLIKCFEDTENRLEICKAIVEILCIFYLKRKTKTPHQYAHQTLVFFNDIVVSFQYDSEIISCFVRCGMDYVCDIIMFCDEMNPCKRQAKEILFFVFNLNISQNSPILRNDFINLFLKLCQEHLAFSSRALFDLFEEIVKIDANLMSQFMPQFINKVKEVECKRSVGYDRALRRGLEQIEEIINSSKSKS